MDETHHQSSAHIRVAQRSTVRLRPHHRHASRDANEDLHHLAELGPSVSQRSRRGCARRGDGDGDDGETPQE